MQASNFSIESGQSAKIIAVIIGFLCGCMYAPHFRNASEPSADLGTNKSSEELPRTKSMEQNQMSVNETALFLVGDDTSLADGLARNIRVLCWMQVNYIDTLRFDAIKKTWGRRCTAFIAITSTGTNSTDIFHIPADENQQSNLGNSYRFVANTYIDKFDWFLYTDGNSYIVVENLRYNLYQYDPIEPFAIGLLKNVTNQSQQQQQLYLSMKAGFALSSSAVGNLVAGFANASVNCASAEKSGNEITFSLCLQEAGIFFGKSTDQHGKQLFFDQYLDVFLLPVASRNVSLPFPWYQDYKVDHYLDSASNYSIAFYGLSWQQMHVMEFCIYQMRPYGVETIMPPLPERI